MATKWRRQPIVWELYDGTMIEMYINPQSITFNHTKVINKSRTKGGFLLQYWGDDLDTLQINGTTGSAGIEAIEVLYDVYRSEQLGTKGMQRLREIYSGLNQNAGSSYGYSRANTDGFGPGGETVYASDLISRASQVVMWYGHKQYFGYFTNFSITEGAAHPGEYIYTINFSVWKTKGRDVNYMPWHRHPRTDPARPGKWGVSMHPLVSEAEMDIQPGDPDFIGPPAPTAEQAAQSQSTDTTGVSQGQPTD